MNKPEEPMLKEIFQQLKQADEQRAPSFAAMWAAAQARLEAREPAVRLRWRSRWAWAAAVLLIAGGLLVYRTRQPDAPSHSQPMTAQASLSPFVERATPEATIAVAPHRVVRAAKRPHKNSPRRAMPVVPETIVARDSDSEDKTDFIPLRFGSDLAPMESGEVIRVQMSRASLIALGLPVTVERADEVVKADLLIGEDGQARAIRFVR